MKITSWACLVGSELNLIFHWKPQLFIFIKSLFKSFTVEFVLWTTENREVSSANNLGFEVKPSGKSLIQIRKNNRPRVDPWRTPASILVQDECCWFKTTLCFLWYKKWVITFKRLHDIPFCFNLKLYQMPWIYQERRILSRGSRHVIDKYRQWYIIVD